ncbi:MAG: efflux RND transporter periplasmic adaptor subunit [Paracoccus sp. (in: a-proteobacteria)]|nr:efflux RND transporter periplasmic adaptor subunit [Paracoccus sp. (in: a-proteobacteria)]
MLAAWKTLLHRIVLSLAAGLALAGPARTAEPLAVEYVTVVTSDIAAHIRLTGTLEPLDSVDIGFREGGRITEMLVVEGDHVISGQVLARIDPQQLQQALNSAAATLASASATEQQARQAAERAQAMLDRGVGTRAAADEARSTLSAAEAASLQAESALDKARRSLADTEVIAPFDGVVTAREGEPGQVVGTAQVILSLAAEGGVEAVFQTPDMAHLNSAMGQPVALHALEVVAPPMQGVITEIAPLVDAATGSVRLRAQVIDAPGDVALLGASVQGEITLAGGRAAVVPWTALTSSNGRPAVWVVVDGNRSELREVGIARFDNHMVLLSGGVAEGETVVGAGSQQLFPGRLVKDAGGAG